MLEFVDDFDQQNEDFAHLESIVHSAGGYVRPTDNLRAETLEAVQDACRQRRTNRRFGSLAAFVLVLAATGFPGFLLSSHLGPAFVGSADLHRRVAESATKNHAESNWALYEVFRELRWEHAQLLTPQSE